MKPFILAMMFLFLPFLTFAEAIHNFSATYVINDDSSITVIEEITYDFGDENRHGIFRTLTKNHPQAATVWYKDRFVDITIVSVERNGTPESYEISTLGKDIEVKVGSPESTIIGEHTYRIVYTLRGALSYGTNGAELYWNATGNGWEIPMQDVAVEVIAPMLLPSATCYQGVQGSTKRCTVEVGSTSVVFSTTDLMVNEGLTLALALDASMLPVVIKEKIASLYSIILQGIFLLGLLWYLIRSYQQDKIKRPVIAQYEPYEKYLPMYTGVLFDKTLDAHDVTAGILYLAQQGFLSITKTSRTVLLVFSTTDYDITLLRPLDQIPTHFLIRLMGLLFSADATVGSVVAISTLAKNATANQRIIMDLQKDITADLKENGFIVHNNPLVSKRNIWLAIVIALCVAVWSFLLLIISVVIVGIFALLSRRTKRGYEAQNHIEGFKLFLSVTDKERFTFFNAPDKSPELFMEYLPYAVALKVEKEWAKVFEGITLVSPAWYHDGAGGSFSAAALVTDLGSFSTSFASSSGTSGSSGGGSSGGGGGGGGGGSW